MAKYMPNAQYLNILEQIEKAFAPQDRELQRQLGYNIEGYAFIALPLCCLLTASPCLFADGSEPCGVHLNEVADDGDEYNLHQCEKPCCDSNYVYCTNCMSIEHKH